MNGEGRLKIRDFIGNSTFRLINNEISEPESKRLKIKRDLMSLIKLIRVMVYDKNIELSNKNYHRDFMKILEHYLKDGNINFRMLLNHRFIKKSGKSGIRKLNKNFKKAKSINKSEVFKSIPEYYSTFKINQKSKKN